MKRAPRGASRPTDGPTGQAAVTSFEARSVKIRTVLSFETAASPSLRSLYTSVLSVTITAGSRVLHPEDPHISRGQPRMMTHARLGDSPARTDLVD